MQKIYKLTGVVQNYQWGGTQFIPSLLGQKNNNKQPCAELWMGAHHKGMAQIRMANGSYKYLNEFMNQNPQEILGKEVVQTFQNKLPFLFKVLDVKQMLSIQSHPTKAVAQKGFEKENQQGIALTAFNRTYRDNNHKPEVMVALTDFWLLHGFKDEEKILQTLNQEPELASLKEFFKNKNIAELYKAVMTMPQAQVNSILAPLQNRILPLFNNNKFKKTSPHYWAAQAFIQYTKENGDIDRGIFSVYVMNIVNVQPGQGIFQDAGILHAYLEGVNIELMANSDNVFRGGLTQKFINVPELLVHTQTTSITPTILQGEKLSTGETIYKTKAKDFELSSISLKENEEYANTSNSIELFIVTKGEVRVINGSETKTFKKGESFVMIADTNYTIQASKESELYKAAVPLD